jgi:hypothetical protein
MPRKFDPLSDEDKIIYDEEEEAKEMYFMLDGLIGVAFSLISNGMLNKQYHIAKKMQCSQRYQTILCEHYVINKCKSQFIYIALARDATCYALTREFLHETVFPKYPGIFKKLQRDSAKLYNRHIYKPINEIRKFEIS